MTKVAYAIASAIKRCDPDRTYSIEVMQYSLTIILNTGLIILSTLGIGWLVGELQGSAIAMVSLMILRLASGGVHMRSAWACNLLSTSIFLLIPIIASRMVVPVSALNVATFFIMLLYAPQPDQNTNLPVSWHPALKMVSILLTASNFYWDSEVIGLAFFVQSLTIIPFRKEGKIR